jgi:phosphopantothenoylcysteine decarboxylase/phosphopantothenate--cysteine ligase
VVVTAGGTREPIDPVRFIGNRSSGKQGYAFARVAVARGARVTLVSANVALPDPAGAEVVRVGTAEELRLATVKAAEEADVVVMAAAPADFRPECYEAEKIKKREGEGPPTLRLVTNPDIAAELGARKRPDQVLVAFAAETAAEPVALANAREKLLRKRADLIVVNEVGIDRTFGADNNTAIVLGAAIEPTRIGERSKDDLADAVLDLVSRQLSHTPDTGRAPNTS